MRAISHMSAESTQSTHLNLNSPISNSSHNKVILLICLFATFYQLDNVAATFLTLRYDHEKQQICGLWILNGACIIIVFNFRILFRDYLRFLKNDTISL